MSEKRRSINIPWFMDFVGAFYMIIDTALQRFREMLTLFFAFWFAECAPKTQEGANHFRKRANIGISKKKGRNPVGLRP